MTVEQRDWLAAYDELAAADRDGQLGADELELLGLAAFLTGHDAESDAARERAHHAHLAAGNPTAAVRAGYWLGLALTLRGEPARGGGWFARCVRVLDEGGLPDSVWRGYLLVPSGMRAFFSGDLDAATAVHDSIEPYVERFGDVTLQALYLNARGQTRIARGEVDAGLAVLDEAMVAVTTAPDVYPQAAGLVYCAVIGVCQRNFDVRRGREWTDALTRWCDQQHGLVPYRGQCLVHRAELLQLHGSWPDAMAEVRKVREQFDLAEGTVMNAAGMALYQQGELHRLRGELTDAEDCYRRASQVGHDPQPGLALLRLARGQTDTAWAAIRRATEETAGPFLRPRLLPAYVDIALAVGDIAAAGQAAAELTAAASGRDVPLLRAAALHATGAVQLAEGDPGRALATLRQACAAWQDIAAPHHTATSRVLVAQACRALGDDDTAELELEAARWTFEQLGAAPDVARVAGLARRSKPQPAPGGLTLREVQVLRLVATGKTNREIAQELFLSEKTVARHIANMFLKLDVSSRSAATAFAYENALV